VLTLPPSVRIYLAVEPTNLRMSFRGLSGLVRQRLRDDPLSGHLFCFLHRRLIPMTYNLSERELGIIGRGRKNYLFAGGDEGAKRLATLYTIVRTCQRLGIDPYSYLCDVLPRLSNLPVNWDPGLLGRLTPQAWKVVNSLVV
jgi:hypothetical protein